MTEPVALVTGANGWLGIRLVRALVSGLADDARFPAPQPPRTVRCLVLPSSDTSELEQLGGAVHIHPGDVRNPSSLRDFFAAAAGGTLFHTAGVIHPRRRTQELFEVNVRGTENVVTAAARAGVRRLVHVSSNSPIGTNASNRHVFDEGSPYNPYMGYGLSKRRAEDIVNRAGASGELEAVIIRPPWFYGPHQPARQTRFFTMIKTGRVPIVGDGENRRSMAYVDNICQGLLLGERVEKASGRTYWIADRNPYTMNEIVDTIEGVMEHDFGIQCKHRRVRLPGAASAAAYLADKILQNAGFYSPELHVLSEMNKNIACSVERARRELGYEPKVSLAEGMRRSLAWMRERGIQP
ncbi:MAG: NAD-dependent epimerase/dehydratase family protein [Candidatus Schekmanbacteria bacterium]|nr:NAD-dependent epimerase/dehydratase family protein [Candidatus Schekmanbacteria bacterium]